MKNRLFYLALVSFMGFFSNPLAILSQDVDAMRQLIYDYGVIGYKNVKFTKNLDSAEYYLNKALDLQYAYYDTIDDRVARNHINLASVYRRIYKNEKALEHLEKAEEILQRCDPESHLFGSIYNNKGNIIRSNYDIFRTRQYYEYALDWLIKTGNRNTNDFLAIYSNYIDILFEMREYDLAMEYLAKVDIENLILDSALEIEFHITKGANFTLLSKYDEALQHYNLAFELLKKEDVSQNIYHTSNYYRSIINYYITTGDYMSAINKVNDALSFVESLDQYSNKLKRIYHSSFNFLYANILNEQGKYERALDLIDRITSNLKIFFNEQSITDLNAKIRNENASLLPELYTLRSRVLYNLFQENNEKDILIRTHEAYIRSIKILNSTKLAIQNENSKIFATAAILEVYNEAIYVGKLLYEMTGDLQYLDKSFEFAESSKSFALFSEIKDVEAIEFSDIPHSVKEEEEDLIGEIQGYEEMLYEEQFSSDPDSSLIAFYRDKIFHLKDDYNDLLQEIELNYANYYELKYNPEFVSLKEVQDQLPYRDALIEYVLTDTMLITYIIDKKEINVLTQKIEPDFEDECLEYYRILYRQNFSNGVHDNYRRFVNLGRKFYRILIEPCMEYTDRKSLTIVPDGAITYLPFEGFLTEDVDAEYINYLTLPYMIREYSVGYSHSSTLLFSERLKTKSPENKVLAFAPEYTNPLDKIDSSWNRQADPDFLLPLPGSLKEVQSINETVPSRIFLNEKATESNFKKYASDYSILHLAMHTIMDDERPLQSLLAFTNVEESDTAEDNRLYAYEIYNMKLNAQMAVLSSCSSGFGKMQEGEGMMSLARGFIYAGCPCIVMTLWQVSDKSSSELMSSFYKYLKKGRSKQEAMRLAKIDYLENADDLTSNPYFWSGFVVVGDGSPVYHKTGIIYWLLVVAIFIGTIVFVQYRKGLKR